MPLGLIRKSTLAVMKESVYGTMPSITSAEVISMAGVPGFNSNFDQIENPLLRNTLSKWPTVRGAEVVSGDITLPFRGSGTAGTAPDCDVLWECGVGQKTTTTASTTTTGSTTSVIELTTGGVAAMGIVVGDAVLIDPLGGSAYEVVWVTSIATDALTISPDMSSAPGTGVDVGAGIHYKLKSDRQSFAAKFWRGDITREDYTGLVAETLEIDFATGQIPLPKLSFQGQAMGSPVTEAYSLGDPSLDSTDFLVARNMVMEIGGTTYKMSNIALSIGYDVFRQLAITSSGTQDILQTGRGITGSFSLLYEDKTVEDAFRADTKAEARIVIGSAAGEMFGIRIPLMRYTEVPKSEESGIYKYDVSFGCDPTSGEDDVSSLSFL